MTSWPSKVGPIDCPYTLVNTAKQICVTSLKIEGTQALILSLVTRSSLFLQFNPTYIQYRNRLKIECLDNNSAIFEIRSPLSNFRGL